MSEKLSVGDDFPRMSINLVGAGELLLPAPGDAAYQVILFYRGHW